MQPSRPIIAISGLGSISALGFEAEGIREGYRRATTRLNTRSFGGSPASVGALSAAAEAALRGFCQEHARYAELDRTAKLGLFAAEHAVGSARWPSQGTVGVVMGSSRGATGLLEQYHEDFLASDRRKVPSLTSPQTTLGNLSSWIAQHVATAGPATEISSTCSTSIYAIGTAAAWLRSGMATRFLAGGTEAPLTDFTIAQMRALRVYSRLHGAEHPCRPCAADSGRANTMVLGEGACVLALERWDACPRNASPPLGVLLGLGFAVEPIRTHTGLSEEGLGLRLSMQRALEEAGLDRVDAVVTHTPGTSLGDRAELNAVRAVFGAELPILTSNKWICGHTLGASGALGIEYALVLLTQQTWAEYPYPTPFQNTRRPIDTVMVNSVGFGGNAGTVIVARSVPLERPSA